MQISKQKLNPHLKKQIHEILYQVIADTKNPEEAKLFLKEVLSEVELEMLAKRLAIAYYLDKGRSYENIKNNLQTSSTTVASIGDQLKKGEGLKIALKKVEADEWAEKWAEKLSKMMGKKS